MKKLNFRNPTYTKHSNRLRKAKKTTLFIFLCIANLLLSDQLYAQQIYTLEFSKTLDESKMGFWTRGDYTIYIDLNSLETSFRTSSKEYDKSATNYTFSDSNGSKLYSKSALKYLEAAEILSQASN